MNNMEQPTLPPPPMIAVNDRVLLWYAVLSESVSYNADQCLMYVGREKIGKVPCLAICQDKNSLELNFRLYYCDTNWVPIGVAGHRSVDDAKRRAEVIYPGSIACWVEAHFTEEDAERHINALSLLEDSETL